MASAHENLYPTCNMFYRREAFLAVGGFDGSAAESMGFPPGSRGRRLGMGEDTLAGWRVRRNGRAGFAPDAVVHHHVFPPDLADTFGRAWMVTVFPSLVREVPELRDGILFKRHFELGPRTRVPLYVTVALLLARRPALAAGAGAWWVLARALDVRRHAGSRFEKLQAIPVELALDVVNAAALGVGSIRARRIVL
jgi:hypothetical protein